MRKRQQHIWTKGENLLFKSLTKPYKIQSFLDEIPYNCGAGSRSPRFVIRDETANCFEGALFAAAALRYHGYGCRIVDLRAVRDDDHVIAIFKLHGCWGAVAKSNFSGLRFREPIYRSLRELVISYFEQYFNEKGEKTLRAYSLPLDLKRFDSIDWMTTDKSLEIIGDYLDSIKHYNILTPSMIRSLSHVDRRSFMAGMLGANPEGLYKVD